MDKSKKHNQSHDEQLEHMFLKDIGHEYAKIVHKELEEIRACSTEQPDLSELDAWFYEFDRKQTRRAKWRKAYNSITATRGRAASIIMVLLLATAMLTVNVDAFKVRFFNIVIELEDQYTSIFIDEGESLNPVDELPEEWSDYYFPTSLPEGYTLTTADSTISRKRMVFVNDDQNEIVFNQYTDGTDLQLDTENAATYEVDIGGKSGLMIEKNGITTIHWNIDDRSFLLRSGIDKSILLDIACNIKKIK